MAIPKKGSRKIIVDGVEYRWYIRHKPTYSQWLGWGNLVFAVELTSENPTALLVVEMREVRPDAFSMRESTILKPADVATHIRAALVGGWQPLSSGSPFIYSPPKINVEDTLNPE